ncbi:hypothetical protein MMC22_008580 [Lobaria immixta]|nr:hypothetical protein [Lobaria immixta]
MFHIALAGIFWGAWDWQHPGEKYRGLGMVTGLSSCYMSGLFCSITVYRLFFHRLRHFSGPQLAAVTKLWHVFQCRDSRNYLVLDSMHKQYGNFVRTERRRVWDQALSPKAIREYLPRILRQIWTLEQVIAQFGSKPVIVNDFMQWLAFDSMAEFAFNESFQMMESGDYMAQSFQQRSALALLGPLNSAIWIPRLAFAFAPFAWRVRDWFRMNPFCDSQIKKRLQTFSQTKVAEPDIAAWFIEEYDKTRFSGDEKTRQNLLSSNTATAIGAGSDTTGPSLMLLFFFLAKDPDHAEKTYEELTRRRTCVGKNLALTQIQLVAAILLTKYRVAFAPSENGEALARGMLDQVTAQPGKFRVIFETR